MLLAGVNLASVKRGKRYHRPVRQADRLRRLILGSSRKFIE